MAWLLSWLVQGLAVALVARAAVRMLPRSSAATRYAIWWAAVLLVLLLPVMRGAARPDATAAGDDTALSAPVVDARGTPAATVAPGAAASIVPPLTLPRLPDWVLAVAIGAWLGTAMLGLAQLAYSVSMVRRLKQSCRRLTMPRESQLPLWSQVRRRRRGVRVRASDCLRTAAVLGLRRPIIAVPREVSATLTSAELDQIILHEYAHVRRFDDWGKLLQVAIGAFFGWHPALRLIMREIDLEREAACDDWVVSVTGAPRAYARCLTKMAGFVPAVGSTSSIPYAASTSHITRRIERLLAAPAVDTRRGTARLAPLPALAAIAALVVVTLATVRALPVAMDMEEAATNRPAESISAIPSGSTTADASELRIATAAMVPLSLPFSNLPRFTTRAHATSLDTTASTAMVSSDAAATPVTHVTSAAAAAPSVVAGSTPAAPPPAAAAEPVDASHPVAISASREHVARVTPDAPPARAPHHEAFSLGPVVTADSTSVAVLTADDDSADKTWEVVAGEATARAVAIGARSVGSATRTATTAAAANVKIATVTAASHVKTSSAKTARAIGRATRKVFPF